MKMKLIAIAIRLIMGGIALGLGIWYLSSSIGGASLTYTSVDGFLNAIGATDGDIANANGCFLCGYIRELFGIIGRGTEMFWNAIVGNLWILMAIGFGIFLFIYTAQYLFDATKKTANLDTSEKKLEFQAWFDKVWRQGARVMICGALIGALGMGGTNALRTVANITIRPVMYVGAELSMAASAVNTAATCNALEQTDTNDILNPIMSPFMCVMGNVNSVMLAGAAGGFSLMNYAWMGLGGGAFTWVAGLGLVLMFLIIGFNLFFQILSVVFKLIFIIIFLPFLIAAAAFEPVWKMASGLLPQAFDMVVKSAVQIVGITLKTVIIFAAVSFAADEYFPGPRDGFSAILPPLIGMSPENPDAKTQSVITVFTECEQVALVDGEMDGDKFRDCFNARKMAVERVYPGAFDFMSNGWDFIMMMIGIFVLYFYAVSPRVDKILNVGGKEQFDFGAWVKDFGKTAWSLPNKIFGGITKALGKK
ncbi:MAG: hypothetical protein IJ560_01980 [Alphaproteobacteria bacterium]|nr:hypothetical protein [Alphaproteobacteria bacterium]